MGDGGINIDNKVCTVCSTDKPLAEFYTQKKHSKKKGDWIYVNPECKKCTLERVYAWRKVEGNREAYLESQKRKNIKLADKIKEGKKKYRDSGKQKEWQRNNPDKVKEYTFYREMNKTHEFTEEEWIECKVFFDDKCAYCGTSEAAAIKKYKQKLHKEHVDHNGSNGIENCVPSCKGCNSKKFTFLFEEWYVKDNPVYSEDRYKRIKEWLSKFKEINL